MKKGILITGGTGFLGKRLALALKGQREVVLAARNNKQNDVASRFTGCRVIPMDVSRIESVRDAFQEVRPSVVIHAAATKFVDLAERQPMECVDVNVVGSQNVARVALEYECQTVIGISTDKASPPIRNTYGLSKGLMERMFCALNGRNQANTRFLCVRYGNVAWSTGSVLPIWKRMHDSTKLIGTTGPNMRRFFFTAAEAVKLIMTSLDHADELQGRVLSRYMKAALIRDILDVWIATKGGRWEPIEGRPGEREDEYLIGDLELPYTCERLYDGVKHYVISFNEKAPTPLPEGLSSANTGRLTETEIRSIIDSPPPPEEL